MQVQPYLNFDGRCEEAVTFYQKALGAEVVEMNRFSENPGPMPEGMPAHVGNKIMHASFRIGESTIMASDSHCAGKPNFQGFSLTLTANHPAEAERYFTALAEGGQVQMPLAKTFFSPSFGVVQDRFGVPWMIYTIA